MMLDTATPVPKDVELNLHKN